MEPEREMQEVKAEGSPPTGLAEQDGHSGNNGNQSFQVLNLVAKLPPYDLCEEFYNSI